ncbi:MAG: FAD-binding protein [Thermodesulfobacteriota bacterium]
MDDFSRRDVDVLVLGAGLAGLRAAWAARQADSRARVAVACLGSGPAGSSFANPNAMLGIHVPETDQEREEFQAEVMRLAAPGFADPRLVAALAQDAAARFAELRDLGLAFRTDADGSLGRYPSCFSHHTRLALVFTDLAGAHARFRSRCETLGVEFWNGAEALDILVDNASGPTRAAGAMLRFPDGLVAVRARTVVAALGGPAPLFARQVTGAGNPGTAHALLARAGARLVNEGYFQFLWSRHPDRAFWPIWDLARDGAAALSPDGAREELPAGLRRLSAERATHCPMAHGLPDSAVDRFILARTGPDGTATVQTPQDGTCRVAAMAHAGNGGALVDTAGRTTLAGLYAAGECASGMHGANRLGGAMVLATQVFGARAGQAAAREAATAPLAAPGMLEELAQDVLLEISAALEPDQGPVRPFTPDLHAAVLLGEGPGLDTAHARISAQMVLAPTRAGRLAAQAALLVTGFLRRGRVYAAQAA